MLVPRILFWGHMESVWRALSSFDCPHCDQYYFAGGYGVWSALPDEKIEVEDLVRCRSCRCDDGHEAEHDVALLILRGTRWVFVPARDSSRDEDDRAFKQLKARAIEYGDLTEDDHVSVAWAERCLAIAALDPDPTIRLQTDGLAAFLSARSEEDLGALMRGHPELFSASGAAAIALLVRSDPDGIELETQPLKGLSAMLDQVARLDTEGQCAARTAQIAQEALEAWRATGLPEYGERAHALNAIARQQIALLNSDDVSFDIDLQCLEILAEIWISRGDDADRQRLQLAGYALTATWGARADAGVALDGVIGTACARRYEISGEVELLDEAIRRHRRALAATSPGTREARLHTSNLAGTLGVAADLSEGDNLLGEAISLYRALLDEAPLDASDYCHCQNNLSNLLSDRYLRRGELEDIERATEAAAAAVEALTPDVLDHGAYLITLANRLGALHGAKGRDEDLASAVSVARQAVAQTPETHPQLAKRLNNLALHLNAAYRHWGEPEIIDETIARITEALSLLAPSDPSRRIYLRNLSGHLLQRYQRGKATDDLDRAVATARDALDACPVGDPERALALSEHAAALTIQFEARGRAEDLDRAIADAEAASTLLPDGLRAQQLTNLAGIWRRAFLTRADPAALSHALDAARRGLANATETTPLRAQLMALEGELLQFRFRQSRTADDRDLAIVALARAIDALRDVVAIQGSGGDPGDSLTSATRLLSGLLAEARRIEALVEHVEAGRLIRIRAAIQRASGAPAGLSSAELEEYSRLLAQEAALAREVEHLSGPEADPRHLEQSLARAALQLMRARDRRDHLEATESGFSRSATTFSEVAEMAAQRSSAIIYLVPLDGQAGSLCVVVHPKSIGGASPEDLIWVASFRQDDLNEIVAGSKDAPGWILLDRMHRDRLIGDDAWLAAIDRTIQAIAEPFFTPLVRRLMALGVNRVVLIPSGKLGYVPLHAARIGPEARPFCEQFEVRYAPCAEFLSNPVPRHRGARSVAAVIDPLKDLPSAAVHGLELEALYRGACIMAYGDDASLERLKNATAMAEVYDFSTHGGFDRADAGRASILLSPTQVPDRLMVRDLLRGDLRLSRGTLVIAGACETGLFEARDQDAEDQLGFPAALLFAGAGAVIAASWRVSDVSAWLFGGYVHEALYNGLSADQAVQRAAATLRTLRVGDLVRRLRTAEAKCVVAVGAGGDERSRAAARALRNIRDELRLYEAAATDEMPFAHPFHWGAYSLHGRGWMAIG